MKNNLCFLSLNNYIFILELVPFLITSFGAQEVLAVEEADYHKWMTQNVRPFFETFSTGSFPGHEGVLIGYRSYQVENEKGVIVFMPGRGESIQKYEELFYDIKDWGYSIYSMAPRGQGESSLIKDIPYQYVDHFDDYVNDFETFMNTIVRPKDHNKTFIFAHSMSAAAASIALAKNPGLANAAVFSAPMFDIRTRPLSSESSHSIMSWMVWAGMGEKPVHLPAADPSRSQLRFDHGRKVACFFPDKSCDKMTFRWIWAALDGVKKAQEIASLVRTPIFLLQADKDQAVPKKGQNRWCETAQNCRRLLIPNAGHALLMESDDVRDEILDRIDQFISRF